MRLLERSVCGRFSASLDLQAEREGERDWVGARLGQRGRRTRQELLNVTNLYLCAASYLQEREKVYWNGNKQQADGRAPESSFL